MPTALTPSWLRMLPQMRRRLPRFRRNRAERRKLLMHVRRKSEEVSMPRAVKVAALSALVLSNPESATLVESVLAAHGFQVVSAHDAATAMDLCKRQRFDLAVYDTEISGTLG